MVDLDELAAEAARDGGILGFRIIGEDTAPILIRVQVDEGVAFLEIDGPGGGESYERIFVNAAKLLSALTQT